MLSHTAGTNNSGFPGHAEDEALPTLLQVLDGKPPANTPPVRVIAVPGAAFRYSGGGTTIVQQMLVDLHGRPFASLMDAAVLAPFGLAHSTFDQPPAHDRFPSLAIGHDHDGSTEPGGRIRYAEAAGGLWTTAGDLARLVAEIQLGLEGRSALVSRELATRLTTPVASIGGGMNVALGTFVEKHGGTEYFGHDGHGPGVLTMVRASKTKGEGAVVIANGAAAAPLLLEILRSVAAEYGWEGWLAPPVVLARASTPGTCAPWRGDMRAAPISRSPSSRRRIASRYASRFTSRWSCCPSAQMRLRRARRRDAVRAQRGAAGVERLVKTSVPWPPRGGLGHARAHQRDQHRAALAARGWPVTTRRWLRTRSA